MLRWPGFIMVVTFLFLFSSQIGYAKDFEIETRDGATVVHLHQEPCLFIESEKDPQSYQSKQKEDCERINRQTADEREFKTLRLEPGRHIFRVTNVNVPYELGFWVRGKGLGRVTLPSVSGGGLLEGETQEYEINLAEGEYYYSCPLNPTPNYPLIVESS